MNDLLTELVGEITSHIYPNHCYLPSQLNRSCRTNLMNTIAKDNFYWDEMFIRGDLFSIVQDRDRLSQEELCNGFILTIENDNCELIKAFGDNFEHRSGIDLHTTINWAHQCGSHTVARYAVMKRGYNLEIYNQLVVDGWSCEEYLKGEWNNRVYKNRRRWEKIS